MDAVVFDKLLYETLLVQLGEGIDSMADRLIELHDRLTRTGTDPQVVEVLRTVLAELGWWSGQIEGTLDRPAANP